MAVFGVLLLLVARGVFLGRRWSRGPAVATQLILLPIAWSFKGGSTTWVSVVLAALAIAVLVGVLHPRSTAVFVAAGAVSSAMAARSTGSGRRCGLSPSKPFQASAFAFQGLSLREEPGQLGLVRGLRLGLVLDAAEE